MRYERDGYSVDSAIKKKRPLPSWYLEQPPRVPGDDFFHTAFRDLSTERNADGPIPWRAAMAYADRKGLRPDLASALWIVIFRMDLAERRWRLEALKQETGIVD